MPETTQKLELAESPSPSGLSQENPQTEDFGRFTKKRKKKGRIIAFILVLAILGTVAYFAFGRKSGPPLVAYTTLEKQELSNTVSLTGTVESADAVRVYSSLGSTVQSVDVQVGDRVSEGDVLAKLDTADLALSIAQQQAVIGQAAKANEHSIEVSKKKLENAQNDVDSGLDAQLVSAENSLKTAQQNLNQARIEYNDSKDLHTDADDELDRAEKEFYAVQNEYEEAKINIANETITEEEFTAVENKYNQKNSVLINAQANVSELSTQRIAYRQARVAYENALANKESAENAVKQQLESYEDNVTASEISADQTANQIALQKLQKQLADSTLTAPISGTVTAVYAKVGAPGSGLMFVIENTDDLVVKTKIKEYDVTAVKEGMAATIKSDATGEREFEGEVQRIYPAAVKAADGSTQTGGNVEFETEVAMLSQDSELRVGMNVRLNIVTEHKSNVYAVPYEAVTMDEQGRQIVYIAKEGPEGKMLAEAVPVQTGMETDFHIEVSSGALADGDRVLTDPSGITAGSEIMLAPQGAAGGVETAGAAVTVRAGG